MIDSKFHSNSGPHSLKKIAAIVGCEIDSNLYDIQISAVQPLAEAGEGDISFLSNRKYTSDFMATKATACIVPADFEPKENASVILLKCSNSYFSYANILDLFYGPAHQTEIKIEPSAHVANTAQIGEGCYIGHNVVIGENVVLGKNSEVKSGTVIYPGVTIGDNARIESNVTISHAIIGRDAVILSGAVIGQDGFGFATDAGRHKKIYHIGRVVIGDDVEIGANTCIDRGSLGDTIIEDFCRLDNLVQVGHNVHIKKGAIIVAQAGIAGSSTIGSYSALGGQVGIAGHISIADGVQISGQGGVIKDVKEPGIYGGTPVVPIRDWHRQSFALQKLIKRK